MKKLFTLLTMFGIFAFTCGGLAAQDRDNDDVTVIHMIENVDVLQFVGQFNNTGTKSQQFGYLSRVEGIDSVFSSDIVHNETTALFTFVTNATNVQVILNGPLRIVNRTGSTTIYLNTQPANFSNPASFSQGTPIQVSTYRQQVVLNTLTNAFTTVHLNTITEIDTFALNGATYRLGQNGNSFRTIYSGQSNAPGASPSGWFAGHAVGIK